MLDSRTNSCTGVNCGRGAYCDDEDDDKYECKCTKRGEVFRYGECVDEDSFNDDNEVNSCVAAGGGRQCGPNAKCRGDGNDDGYTCECFDGYVYRNGVCTPRSGSVPTVVKAPSPSPAPTPKVFPSSPSPSSPSPTPAPRPSPFKGENRSE